MHVGGCSSCCIYCCCAERVHFLLHLFAIFIIYFISLLHSDFFIYIFVWLCERHFQRQLQLNRKPKCLREQLLCCCCCWYNSISLHSSVNRQKLTHNIDLYQSVYVEEFCFEVSNLHHGDHLCASLCTLSWPYARTLQLLKTQKAWN